MSHERTGPITGNTGIHNLIQREEVRIINRLQELESYRRTSGQRRAVEDSLVAKSRKEPDRDRWKTGFGDYGYHPLTDARDSFSTLLDNLYGDERYIDQQINRSFTNAQHEDGSPVVFVDFGAGLGISAIRIAAQRRKLIEDGKLLIIATNLSFRPDNISDNEGYSGIAKLLHKGEERSFTKDELDFVQENQHLVNYLQATAEELPEVKISTPDGDEIELAGNVDVLNEQMALTHSHIPDIAIGILGTLLRRNGIFLLGTDFMHFRFPTEVKTLDGQIIDTNSFMYGTNRDKALKVGISVLKQIGLTKIGGSSYRKTS